LNAPFIKIWQCGRETALNFGGNREEFAEVQFAKNETVAGLGFDQTTLEPCRASLGGSGKTFPFASPKSFGHSGLRGPFIWADPEEAHFYILSNRGLPVA